MNFALTQIRAKIADLETKIVNLRIAEQELLELEPAPSRKEKAPVPHSAEHALTNPSSRPQTIGAAITEVLINRSALSVAQIAEEIEAGGREIDRRKVSFSLQALKKRGLAKMKNGNWMLTKGRAARVSRTSPKGNLKTQRKTRKPAVPQTVGDHISRILTLKGPLALAELAKNIKAAGGKVKNSTLSNTLQKMKLRGLIASADGKWQLM